MPFIERRTGHDRARAQIAAAGIIMMSVDGRAAAAAFLERERLPFRVIVRVLAEPDRRRPAARYSGHGK